MLRSHASTLSSMRRVTERNAGRKTAGVAGEVVLTADAGASLSTSPYTNWRARGRPVGGVRGYAVSRRACSRPPGGLPASVAGEVRPAGRTARFALGASAVAVDDIGSTAAPGLPTMDCLDVQVRMTSIAASFEPVRPRADNVTER